MKKQILFLLITLLSLNCYSQIKFEKGHYINNDNQKINCFIKNVDWRNNPTEFSCTLSEDSETKILTIKSVKEFEMYNISKYVRSKVNIDRSSDDLNKLSDKKEPIFSEEELFLKVLVEGKASLYQFVEGNRVRYFYKKEGSNIEQLILKRYYPTDNLVAHTNNEFRRQLWKDLKCSRFKMSKLEKLAYKKNSLTRFFIEYNNCNNFKVKKFEKKKKKDLFNLNVRPGFNSSSFLLKRRSSGISTISPIDADLGNQLTFRFGVEAEFIMGFNKSKWAIIVEPTYQYFKSSEIELTNQTVKVDYNSIELPIGIRHYFYLNEKSKFFINASYIMDFVGSNSIADFSFLPDLDIETSNNAAFGLGFKQNDKYSLEFRYFTKRSFFEKATWSGSNYNTMSVIFGYSFF